MKRFRWQTTFAAAGLILLSLASCAPTLLGETFTQPPLIQTGSNPAQLVQGDFNGDGKMDMVYADGSPPVFHVLLGNGDGTFQHGQDIPVQGGFPTIFAIADINHDGKPDLVLGQSGSNPQFDVLLGNGDGTFQTAVVTPLPSSPGTYGLPAACGVADFNGDGALDAIVSDFPNNAVYVLLGNNTGSFIRKATLQLSTGPDQVLTGDFNGDGHPDFLVHVRLSGIFAVYLGKGDGTFQSPAQYSGNAVLLLADMDGDGRVDMVESNFAGIQIFHGNADGTFATTSEGGIASGSSATLLAVADFNGDGILDIAAQSSNGIAILLGQGHLTYGSPLSYAGGPGDYVQGIPNATAVMADFNQDGRPDIAVTVPGGLAMLFGKGDGSFQTFKSYDLGAGVSSLAVADLNGDHIPDIAANVGSTNPVIMLGTGGGRFNFTPATSGTGMEYPFSQILTGDFNGDGKPDLLLANAPTDNDLAFFGNGDGTFSQETIANLTPSGRHLAAVADLNKDGASDIVSGEYLNLDILLGQRNNTFTLSSIYVPGFIGSEPMAFGDFNDDGKLDIIVGNQVYLGNGDGTFQLGRALPNGASPCRVLKSQPEIVTGDFDSDGKIDIVTVQGCPSGFNIYYGKGDGTFEDPVLVPLAIATPIDVAATDLNGDGKVDLVLTDGGIISVVHNLGNRNFSPEAHYLAGAIGGFVLQDVNGDGAPDIVVANGTSSTTVSVLFSQPGGSIVNGTLTVSPEPSALGQPYTITLSLQPLNPADGTPTGSVHFLSDGMPLGTVALTGSTVSFTDGSSPPLGAHSITAEYSGDANFLSAAFAEQHTVVPVVYATTTSLTAAPNPVLASHTVSLTATINCASPVAPFGVAAFYDGPTTLGTGYVATTGVVVFDTALLSPGTHNITASYRGNVNCAPSTSPVVTVVVNANATATQLTAVPSPVPAGGTVTLTAAITSPSGTPTGSAVFYDGTSLLAAQPLDATGTAVYTAKFSIAGTHALSAVYRQNATYASSSSSPVNLVVNSAGALNPTELVLATQLDSSGASSVMLTAVVTAHSGTPTGAIVFLEGSLRLGEAALGPTGIATYRAASPGPGAHYITATYPGSTKFGASASSALIPDESAKQMDFALSIAPAIASLLRGQSAAMGVEVGPRNGFDADVLLSCSTGSPEVTCSLSPASIRGGSGVSRLTIVAVQRLSRVTLPDAERLSPLQFMFITTLTLAVFLAVVPWRWRRLALGALCLLYLAGVFGCVAQPIGTPTSPSASYVVTISGTSTQSGGPLVHFAQVQVTVR